MVEQIMYSTFNEALMTVEQCRHSIRVEIVPPLILLLFAMIFIAGIAFYHIHKYMKLKQFVKENKLEKKFQEWKADNKGLD
jgi:hypothetical protein